MHDVYNDPASWAHGVCYKMSCTFKTRNHDFFVLSTEGREKTSIEIIVRRRANTQFSSIRLESANTQNARTMAESNE